MAGENTIDASQYPDTFGYATCTVLEVNMSATEGIPPILITDRDIVVDSITFMANVDDAANLSFSVVKADSGTAPSSGTSICTAITDTVGAFTSVSGVVDTTENHVTAGQYLAINYSDASATIDLLHVTIRFRTRLK